MSITESHPTPIQSRPTATQPAQPDSSAPPTAADASTGTTNSLSTGAAYRGRRLLGGSVLVALWVGIGNWVGADVVGYLLIGLPLVAAFQLGVRRRPLRELWARDSATVTKGRLGQVCVATALTLIVGWRASQSISAGTWVDDSWQVVVLAILVGIGYSLLRRVFVVLAIAALTVTIAALVAAPRLATTQTGSGVLQSRIGDLRSEGALEGYGDLAVAEVEVNAVPSVRIAGLGAGAATPMEVGSLTKAMTGLVIADSVRRGELKMDVPVSTYLPQLRGSRAGAVTMRELVTHSSGYASIDAATVRRGLWRAPLGLGILTEDRSQTLQSAQNGTLPTRGHYSYSNLGAATAGQAAAAAAGLTYPDLMRTRLFQPLGMNHTAIQSREPLADSGRSASGLRVQPWVMDGYAPAGATVSTAKDLTVLATALLDGTAPGLDALTPIAPTERSDTRIGEFWHISRFESGQTISWHNGQTGGYASYLGLDLEHHRAVIVISDVAKDVADIGVRLLGQTAAAKSGA